jgi:hypothetical protein
MRIMRRAVLPGIFLVVAACSSQSSDEQLNPQPLPPQDEKGGANGPSAGSGAATPTCTGTCCNKPAEGSACDANADTTCSWAVTCPTGLVLPYEVTCENGTWKVTNACPAEGQVDARGCPAREPENQTPCSLASNTSQCGYVLECTGYRKSALVTCTGGTWQATPLASCD